MDNGHVIKVLQGQNLLDKLVLCCSDTLRLDLKSEGINPMVHRNHLRSLKQGENEPIRNYVARLREAAMDC